MASKNYEFVSFICESGTASPAEIAERFSVGTRTVYNRINRANDDLAGIAQIERRGEGFALAVADDERFAEWLRRRGDALRIEGVYMPWRRMFEIGMEIELEA